MQTPSTPEHYIGLMSGTSLDGVDAVLIEIDTTSKSKPIKTLGKWHQPFSEDLRRRLLSLHEPQGNELHTSALLSNELADLYALAVHRLLTSTGMTSADIVAIGAHGQTVRHQPDLGYTIQLNAPARLAELCGIDVVADFRSRDMAASGQGAPLTPAFHAHLFGGGQVRILLNLGGIANVTILRDSGETLGFDTGPANMLMDAWCQKHTGAPFDDEGQWGAGGTINWSLLEKLLSSQPWFALPAPKSTGRDLFNLAWLQNVLEQIPDAISAQDVQATLQHLTAQTVLDALRQAGADPTTIYGCGGGVRNTALMGRFKILGSNVTPTDVLGVDAQDMEAMAFAWLAWAHKHRIPINLSNATGAKGPRILGALWPA